MDSRELEAKITSKSYSKEDVMQADFMQWAYAAFPCLRTTLFHIENEGNVGGRAGAIKGGIALSKGKLAGVPDNLCVLGGKMVFFEFKLANGHLSDTQKVLHEIWINQGVRVELIRDFQTWKSMLTKIVYDFYN